MKNLTLLLIIMTTLFVACKKDEIIPEPAPTPDPTKSYAYVVNYGAYGGTNSEISIYNITDKTITQNAYSAANSTAYNSNIQFMSIFNGSAYCIANNGDKIDVINSTTLVQSANPIYGSDIVNPRYIVFDGLTAYVSCWGVADWDIMPNSYIAKINLSTFSISKIALPGGPEGLALANGKLYAALNYKDSIASINLSNDQVSYIATPAVSSYFLKDNSNNLYVSLVSTYSDTSSFAGIAYINTSTDQLTNNYLLSGITSNYGSIMQFNSDKSRIYIVAAAYDVNYVLKGGIHVFNTTSKSYETPFLENVTGLNGVNINPANNDVYVLLSPSATANGSLKVYSSSGALLDTKETGIAPQQVLFLN